MKKSITDVASWTLNFPKAFLDMVNFCRKAGLVKEEKLSPERLTLDFLRYDGCRVGDHDASVNGVGKDIEVIPDRDDDVVLPASESKPSVDTADNNNNICLLSHKFPSHKAYYTYRHC
ncbi:unnamed protein product [Orchesella dallaii]|uniref:Uncharacterized protein n=1 Tax=Orchesella dallaii TaxID=48710 RepID=A0ABP1PHQ4_9HEXA